MGLCSTLILHLGFFGRLLTLYTRNLNRVKHLSEMLQVRGDDALSLRS